jgi:hypothetical protein
MPNILDFVRGLLTDTEEQKRFAEDARGYVTEHGFADLSGEDVTEALRRLTPAPRPEPGETELDAAVRLLRFAISRSSANGPEHEVPATGRDRFAEFGDEMAAIVRNASAQVQAAVGRAENIRREAERDAEAIREAAQVDAQTVRGQAERDGEAMLESARSKQAEAASALETARAKREEILAAEHELRKQLEGVQSVFQSLQHGDVPYREENA